MAWTPLVTDPQHRARIDAAIESIAAGIGKMESSAFNQKDDPSLMYGNFGLAVFYGFLYKYTGNIAALEKFNETIDKAFDLLINTETELNFGRGLSGAAWSLQLLINNALIDADIDELTADIKDKLTLFAKYCTTRKDCDYMIGGLGPYLFSLERARSGYIDPELNKLVESLKEIAFTPSDTEYFWEQILHDGPNRINFGIAHGIPGLMVLLSKCYKYGIQQQLSKELIHGAFTYLQKHRLSDKQSCFPYSIDNGKYTGATPLRWCYGDIGIAIALYITGKNIQDETIEKEGISLGLRCAGRVEKELAAVTDAHLCHGSAGIAQVMSRFYNYTGIEKFREAALYCTEDVLSKAIHHPDFIVFTADKGDFGQLHLDGLLEGTAGIGLCLLALVDNNEPDWDSCLLLS